MLKLIYIVCASALWLCVSIVLCVVIETAPVGMFGLACGLSVAAIVVFVIAASMLEWKVLWWVASWGAVAFACSILHPLMRLEAAFGTFLPPAEKHLTRYDREMFMQYELGGGPLGGILAVLATLAVVAAIAGLLFLLVRMSENVSRTQVLFDLATFGPHRTERLRELALGDDSAMAIKAIGQLDYERDRETLKKAAHKYPGILGMGFLRSLPYPEEEEYLRKALADHPKFEHYDFSQGWPHTHSFTEVSREEPDPNQTVLDEACTCGLHRITRTTVWVASTCPRCGQKLKLQWNNQIYKSWDEPPKPWYGYDAYCDPDMYTSGWTCEFCGCYLERYPGFELGGKDESITYEWES